MRPMPSAEPPGANGTMIWIGFCDDWASAALGSMSDASDRPTTNRIHSSRALAASVAAWLRASQRAEEVQNVIPGRASISAFTRVFDALWRTRNPETREFLLVWIPGSRLSARPGMTGEGISLNSAGAAAIRGAYPRWGVAKW